MVPPHSCVLLLLLHRSDWGEVEDVARAVLEFKERHYKELTAEGIRAFPGAR